MQYSIFDTAWGTFAYVARGKRLVATFLLQREQAMRRAIIRRWLHATEAPDLLPKFREQVIRYFEGRPTNFSVTLDLAGLPPFRRAALAECRKIPYGKTVSYGDLARAVGNPGATRAVGGAMAHNPLPLVIPCHRVLRSNGSLGGFSSRDGVKDKARLLELEAAVVSAGGQ